MKNVAACIWKLFMIGMLGSIFALALWVALVQGELAFAQGEFP